MDIANEFFNKLVSESQGESVAKLGRIVKLHNEFYADIQPLPSLDNSVVLQVPLMFPHSSNAFVYIPYEVGDLVLLIYVDFNIDSLLQESDNPSDNLVNAENDCVCVGRVPSFNTSLEGTSSDSVCMKNKGSSIELKGNGDIEIKGKNVKIVGDRIDLN